MKFLVHAVICILVFIPSFAVTVSYADEVSEANQSNEENNKPLQVPKASSHIRIDAVLDEPAWEKALILELPYEVYPGENTPAPVKTECLLTYNESCLYAAFRAYDPEPSKIRAHIRDRRCFDDDFVGIYVDTFNDQRRAFRFWVNPYGVQQEGTVDEIVGMESDAWDAIWDSAGRITDEGYIVEMAIPFSQLRFQRTDGKQVWGFQAIRKYPRDRNISICSQKNDRNIDSQLTQYLKIEGFEGVSPGRNVEITPTITGSRTEAREGGYTGDFVERDSKSEIGVTTTWGVTPNMTLGLALNPDFSNVEADVAQLEINQRFALYYPEKRPIFLESANYFDDYLSLLHTRTLADPSVVAKFAGKEGGNTIGFLLARDEITNLVFPGSQGSRSTSLDIQSTAAAFRYRRDIGRNSSFGLTFTDREADNYCNRVLGFDTLWRFTQSDTFRFGIASSQTAYPYHLTESYTLPEGEFSDRFFRLNYMRRTRKWFIGVTYEDIGEGFRADLAHLPQVNLRSFRTYDQYTIWGKQDDFFSQIRISIALGQSNEQNGDLLSRYISPRAEFNGPMQSYFMISPTIRESVYNGVVFKRTSVGTSFGMTPSGSYSFFNYLYYGDAIDYENTRKGRSFIWEPSISLNLGSRLRMSLNHRTSRFTVEGARLFLANLPQATIIYHFNRKAFFRAILQYRDIRQNPELYSFPVNSVTKRLLSQFLFSYKLNPRTVLFIGYSDNHLGTDTFSLTQTDRTFFVKLGYAWIL